MGAWVELVLMVVKGRVLFLRLFHNGFLGNLLDIVYIAIIIINYNGFGSCFKFGCT